MKAVCIPLVMAACLVFAVGCSDKPKGNFKLAPRRVTIVTEPAGATVTQLRPLGQPSVRLGVTPLHDQQVTVLTDIRMRHMPFGESQELLRHANSLVVRIDKDGYQAYQGAHPTQADQVNEYTIQLQPQP